MCILDQLEALKLSASETLDDRGATIWGIADHRGSEQGAMTNCTLVFKAFAISLTLMTSTTFVDLSKPHGHT